MWKIGVLFLGATALVFVLFSGTAEEQVFVDEESFQDERFLVDIYPYKSNTMMLYRNGTMLEGIWWNSTQVSFRRHQVPMNNLSWLFVKNGILFIGSNESKWGVLWDSRGFHGLWMGYQCNYVDAGVCRNYRFRFYRGREVRGKFRIR